RFCHCPSWHATLSPPLASKLQITAGTPGGFSSRCGCVSDNPRHKRSPLNLRSIIRTDGALGALDKACAEWRESLMALSKSLNPKLLRRNAEEAHLFAPATPWPHDLPRPPQSPARPARGRMRWPSTPLQTNVARAQVTQGASAVHTR